jgi:hypothetical protein
MPDAKGSYPVDAVEAANKVLDGAKDGTVQVRWPGDLAELALVMAKALTAKSGEQP